MNDKKNNPVKNKIVKNIENKYEEYINNGVSEDNTKSINTNNIMFPILKIIIVFIITLALISIVNNKKTENILKYIDKIEGTWIDEYDNHYEITSKSFQMNSGIKDLPFYEGNITNIIKTEEGFKILIKGIQYELNLEEKTRTKEKDLDLSFEILEYKEEKQTPMKVVMNEKEFSILKVE